MATDQTALLAVPAAAALLLWPALWNGYPIVFADTGTYLSQAIHHYAGWDRPVFYSVFMLPLHLTVTVWPVVVVQALEAAWVLWRVVLALVPDVSGAAFVGGVAGLAVCSGLPWVVSELMPDLFTPLLVLVVCLLGWVPERLLVWERWVLVGFAGFMIATQQSSLPLAFVLGVVLGFARGVIKRPSGSACVGPRGFLADVVSGQPGEDVTRVRLGSVMAQNRFGSITTRLQSGSALTALERPLRLSHRWRLIVLPPALAVIGLCSINLAAHGRFAVSPFGNVFLLARVIYDGPGMAVLRRDCPTENWRLCPFLDSFPETSDGFLWAVDGPLQRAGGAKLVSLDAGAIIEAALLSDPVGEARAALANTLEQLTRFASGDGLNAWPEQVSPWIARDFPAREQAAYGSARQQAGGLAVPWLLSWIHTVTAVVGVVVCAVLLPVACGRRAVCAGFLLTVLLALPVGAAITGSLSTPHDRYQARIVWLAPFVAVVSVASMRRRPV